MISCSSQTPSCLAIFGQAKCPESVFISPVQICGATSEPGKRGKQFEHFVKWFLQNDPEWSTQVDHVWLWEEYPERWGIDCGIDIVFRHKNGESWAVQAKCYSQQHDITKHDVDKFLSESNRKGIDKRLLIATTDRIGANAKQVCEAQEKGVFRYLLSNFESANLEYPATLARLHTAKRKPKPAPREHQLEAIDGVVDSFQSTDRGQLIMACGTGKTFTTLWIKERLEATSTLILLPSLGLLSQTLHEWTLAANSPFEVLCVCSDETVGKKGADEAIHSITDVAFPVTSNVEEIREFLSRAGAKVVFSTYQSSPLVAEAQRVATVPDFDFAIADEAHRCAGKVGNDFTTVLDAKRIRASKRLFATATPRTYSTNVKKAAGERGIEVVGMDDEAVFGRVLYSLPFGAAIKRGLLTDYQVVIIGVDNPMIATWIENRELIRTDSGIENDAESLAAQIGLLKAYKDYDLRRVISFHSRVTRAEQFSKDLMDVVGWIGDQHKPSGTMKTDFVSGEMATDKRRIKLSQLKSLAPQERGLLTNARCLSEGVDVPSLDGVAFIDPRSSQIDIIQAVGRAIRLSTNKTAGTIILPVFIEAGTDAQTSIEGSNFKPIWDVLNALKAHDDVLSAELDQIRTEMGRRLGSSTNHSTLSKIFFDLPMRIGDDFEHALRTFLVERVTSVWEFWYGLLCAYVSENHDCCTPQSYETHTGYQLGKWVSSQREHRLLLTSERRSRLEVLPGWTWDTREAAWETGFKHLQDYAAKHETCFVPRHFELPSGYKLGQWVSAQRHGHGDGNPHRIERLESLKGWSWNVRDPKWYKGFLSLSRYAKTFDATDVPAKYKSDDGYLLGRWVHRQRAFFDGLTVDKRRLLEALPRWSWNPIGEAWELGFLRLMEYVKQSGNARPPSSLKLSDGFAIGSWVGRQRSNKAELLSAQRIRLEALQGWSWDPFTESWETGFEHLKEYIYSATIFDITKNVVCSDGYRLGQWVAIQRKNRYSLSESRRIRLESIDGWSWNKADDEWERKFQSLREYSTQNGSSNVPRGYLSSTGIFLGEWVKTQKRNYAKLDVCRLKKLESLPGWIWSFRK